MSQREDLRPPKHQETRAGFRTSHLLRAGRDRARGRPRRRPARASGELLLGKSPFQELVESVWHRIGSELSLQCQIASAIIALRQRVASGGSTADSWRAQARCRGRAPRDRPGTVQEYLPTRCRAAAWSPWQLSGARGGSRLSKWGEDSRRVPVGRRPLEEAASCVVSLQTYDEVNS